MSIGSLHLIDKKWVVDAEPHVMNLFSKLFANSALYNHYHIDNKPWIYTHRPRYVSDSIDTKRDLDWFLQRYPLDITVENLKYLKDGSAEYDRIQYENESIFMDGYELKPLDLALPLRQYQLQACELLWRQKGYLLADEVGLGKTPAAIGSTSKEELRPALVVAPPHLVTQWEQEIKKFLPNAKTHIIYGRKTYDLPPADYYITAYSRIGSWVDVFTSPKHTIAKSLILDEVHDLRRSTTQKYEAVKTIADNTPHKIGLSATPIMNYGVEIHNIFQILSPDSLGNSEEFIREWCTWDRVRDPVLLGNYLRKKRLLLRRTRKDVEKYMEPVNRVVYTVDCDLQALKEMEDVAKKLALQVFTGSFSEAGQAARELDWKLRHATGVAKAKAVAETAKMILDSGEKVVIFGWHRDVYDIWLKELQQYKPVLYTGSESVKEKEASVKKFVDGDSQVFIMSLRSGAGLNGLQEVASYAIFGELDWSPGIHEQCIGRLWRDGQKKKVTSIFITINDGADPFMMRVLGLKRSQQEGIIDPDKPIVEKIDIDDSLMKSFAKEYLTSRNVDIPDKKERPDYIEDIIKEIESVRLHLSNEELMQDGLDMIMKPWAEARGLSYDKEFSITGKDRIDFKIGDVGIECKVGGSKKEMYRQVKRYLNKKKLKAIVVVGPWEEIEDMDVEGNPVYFVNASRNSL